MPADDDPDNYGGPIFLQLYGFTAHTTFVWALIVLVWPNVAYHNMYIISFDQSLKILVRTQLPISMVMVRFYFISLLEVFLAYFYCDFIQRGDAKTFWCNKAAYI